MREPRVPDPHSELQCDPDEDWIIRVFQGTGPALPGLRVAIGDDAAVWADGRLVSVDTMVEGVHWDARLSAADVGFKLAAVNASDIGAMGGRPEWAVLALSLPAPLDRGWVADFQEGLQEGCSRWGIALIGGDTTRSPTRAATLTVGGRASRPILRSGGRPGDTLWVTGALGLAAEGFFADAPRAGASAALRRPSPPVHFGAALAEHALCSAMMDLSDGLRRDLERLCIASSCGATVDPARVPGDGPLAWRVGFGEDYELLFAVAPEHADSVRALALTRGVTVSEVGQLQPLQGIRLSDGAPWPAALFSHFGPSNLPSGARPS